MAAPTALSVDPVLSEALEIVMADITAAATATPEIVDFDWANDDDYPSGWIRWPDGTGRGFGVWPDEPLAFRVVQVADVFQEEIVEALWGLGRSAVWPECPDHPDSHPLKPVDLDGTAVWVCPRTERSVAPIGHLAHG